MINEENVGGEETEVEETETESETENEGGEETQEEEKGVEYWKAEALKNKAILDRNKNKPAPSKSSDFGYDVKAYLKSSGIKANEFDFVKGEMKSSGIKDVDVLLENKYFQAGLEEFREISRSTEATPKGNRSGGVATDSVEYWLAKPIEEVPMSKRREVVNARLAKEQNQSKFYNT